MMYFVYPMSDREPVGPNERTYHGVIRPHRHVIIKQEGAEESILQTLDGDPNIHWGPNGDGEGSLRLAQALTADALGHERFVTPFSGHIERNVVRGLPVQDSFVVSRDRIILEGLFLLNDFVRCAKREGPIFRADIQILVLQQHATREELMAMLSNNLPRTLAMSRFGLQG